MLVAILGTHPGLSLAELQAVYGAPNTKLHNPEIALVKAVTPKTLGGTVKFAQKLAELPTTELKQIDLGQYIDTSKKVVLGISAYGSKVSVRELNKIGLKLKQQLKQQGASVRVVPNKQAALSSAQVTHNKLVEKGTELVVATGKTGTIIAQTIWVQDIEQYSQRDYGRPLRDARVGMLPPKLAQIMLNLALGSNSMLLSHVDTTQEDNEQQTEAYTKYDEGVAQLSTQQRATNSGIIASSAGEQAAVMRKTVLDPFCGTGVLLQEALMMGYNANGTDIDERMVDYSRKNLAWLAQQYPFAGKWSVTQADARTSRFPTPIGALVTETHLGPPLSGLPNPSKLAEIQANLDKMVVDFLNNLFDQIQPDTPLCLAIPFWATPSGPRDLPLVDQIGKFGYTHKSFASSQDGAILRYRRPQQVVGRRILVLERV